MTLLLFAGLLFLLLISAFCSLSETSLFSLSPFALRSYKMSQDVRQNLISRLMEHPRDVLVTILIVNTLVNILVQNTVSTIFEEEASWVLKVGVPLVLTLILGELLPKSLALPQNVAIAPRIAPTIEWMLVILKPIREPLTRIASWVSRILFYFLRDEKEISSDELRHVLKTSEQSKILLPQEASLIGGTIDLQNSIAKERMRPREEVLFFDIRDPLSKIHHLFVDLEISRVPVCDGNLENILGILSARRYFFHGSNIQKSSDLVSILKKPFFVPETTRCWALFRILREKGESLAIVVDEYGSISGLITQEDLFEAVAGEISDRRDEKSLYSRSGSDVIIASGKLELAEFNQIFGVSLKSKENVVTLGGWLIEQLGDIPTAGSKYATDAFLFYILDAEPQRIGRIYVRLLHPIKKI